MTPQELNDYMLRMRLTNRTLSEILGVTPAAIELWLQGKRKISPITSRVIRYFDRNGIDLKELVEL